MLATLYSEGDELFRIFSIKRLALSVLLGFLIPLGYAFTLSEVSDFTGSPAPDFMILPFGWPRPLWIFLMGRQPTEADVIGGIVFLVLCNIALYGAISYAALTMLSLLWRKQTEYEPPPPPEQKYS
jgi:hypothetical protein